MSFQLSRKLTGSQHLCKVSAPGQQSPPPGRSYLSPLLLGLEWGSQSHDPLSPTPRRALELMWPGWSVPADWGGGWRMITPTPDLWTSNLLSRRGCIFLLAAEDQAGRPTGARGQSCEAWRRDSRSRSRPELALAWSVLAHFYKPCLGLLTSLPSLTASTQTICPQTWLLLLFQALQPALLIPAKLQDE